MLSGFRPGSLLTLTRGAAGCPASPHYSFIFSGCWQFLACQCCAVGDFLGSEQRLSKRSGDALWTHAAWPHQWSEAMWRGTSVL